jgi:hypothetical protein
MFWCHVDHIAHLTSAHVSTLFSKLGVRLVHLHRPGKSCLQMLPCTCIQTYAHARTYTHIHTCMHHPSACTLVLHAEVQRRAAPAVASGLDVIIKAETGSGKTLSYLASALANLQYPPELYPDDLNGPQVWAFVYSHSHT